MENKHLKYLGTTEKLFTLLAIRSLIPLTGCTTPPPSVHNQDEAIAIANQELKDICSTKKSDVNDFDAPDKVEDMPEYDPKYHWDIKFSQSKNTDIAVYFFNFRLR
jgi:hypothetical protein